MLKPFTAVLVLATLSAGGAEARQAPARDEGDRQPAQPSDSTAAPTHSDQIVVVARRHPATLATSPEAVSLFERRELDAAPATDLAGALEPIPGLHFYDAGGSQGDPAVNVRGFTGGGENDYLLVLVDGVRINDFGTGRVDWRELPLAGVERVEVLRGPVSALYGDAAVGGVVRIVTRQGEKRQLEAALEAGSYDELGGSLRLGGAGSRRRFLASVGRSEGDGWRQRSGFEDLNGSLRLRGGGDERSWGVDLWGRRDEHQIPGPLSPGLLEASPETALYRSDRVDRRRLALSWHEERGLGAWRLASQGSLRSQEDVSVDTLLIETKERRFDGGLLLGEVRGRRAAGRGRQLSLGLELGAGDYTSDYFVPDPLRPGGRGEQTAAGDGERLTLGTYAQLELELGPRLELLLGLRYDRVEDDFVETIQPDASSSADNDAWSPRVGLLWRVDPSGSLYASLGGSFKAPTPFQLFDQRRPFGVPITNPALEPLRGQSLSLGYRRPVAGRLRLDVALYWLELEDEIGFDPVRFRTDNIGESRHRGAELELDADLPRRFRLRFAHTYTDARIRAGELSGRRIDNVPRHVSTFALNRHGERITASLMVRTVRDVLLDPLASASLEDYATLDLAVSRRFGPFEVRVGAFNLLDERFATWGFVSPLDGLPLVYPGGARSARLTLRYRSTKRD